MTDRAEASAAGIVVRQGSLADLDGVMRVMDSSFDPRFGEAWTAGQCASLLPMPGVWMSVAQESEAIIGFAMSRLVAGEAELLLLAVSTEAQGRGAGGILLKAFEDEARSRGADRLHLEVRDGNKAVRLYEQAGFHVIGRRRSYYRGRNGEAFDALTFAKRA